mmetsp:Transcript_45599/g.71450  ORF Transcript_45599/g.71450 Transcript_45599/m.71450 type:complete len:242 (-) Transcript_45599:633-1358(-)
MPPSPSSASTRPRGRARLTTRSCAGNLRSAGLRPPRGWTRLGRRLRFWRRTSRPGRPRLRALAPTSMSSGRSRRSSTPTSRAIGLRSRRSIRVSRRRSTPGETSRRPSAGTTGSEPGSLESRKGPSGRPRRLRSPSLLMRTCQRMTHISSTPGLKRSTPASTLRRCSPPFCLSGLPRRRPPRRRRRRRLSSSTRSCTRLRSARGLLTTRTRSRDSPRGRRRRRERARLTLLLRSQRRRRSR